MHLHRWILHTIRLQRQRKCSMIQSKQPNQQHKDNKKTTMISKYPTCGTLRHTKSRTRYPHIYQQPKQYLPYKQLHKEPVLPTQPYHRLVTHKITIQKVRAHTCIEGNDIANTLANDGTTKLAITPIPHIHIAHTTPCRPAKHTHTHKTKQKKQKEAKTHKAQNSTTSKNGSPMIKSTIRYPTH